MLIDDLLFQGRTIPLPPLPKTTARFYFSMLFVYHTLFSSWAHIVIPCIFKRERERQWARQKAWERSRECTKESECETAHTQGRAWWQACYSTCGKAWESKYERARHWVQWAQPHTKEHKCTHEKPLVLEYHELVRQ